MRAFLLVIYRTNNSTSCCVTVVEQSIKIRQKSVSNIESGLGCAGNRWPSGGVLGVHVNRIVVLSKKNVGKNSRLHMSVAYSDKNVGILPTFEIGMAYFLFPDNIKT